MEFGKKKTLDDIKNIAKKMANSDNTDEILWSKNGKDPKKGANHIIANQKDIIPTSFESWTEEQKRLYWSTRTNGQGSIGSKGNKWNNNSSTDGIVSQ